MIRYFVFPVILLTFLLSLISCGSSATNSLVGKWNVVTYADPFKATLDLTTVTTEEIYTLQLNDKGLFWFTTDCNTISGEYTVNKHDLKFENISATELACDKEIVERSIKSQLPMVVSYALSGDSIFLLGRQGNVVVKLIKADGQE